MELSKIWVRIRPQKRLDRRLFSKAGEREEKRKKEKLCGREREREEGEKEKEREGERKKEKEREPIIKSLLTEIQVYSETKIENQKQIK